LLAFPGVKKNLRVAAVPLAAIALFLAVARLRRNAVPETPGTVVEHFLDHVSQGRYERAATFLAPDIRGSEGAAAVERWKEEAVRGLGEVRDVRGETEWISGTEAEATGVIRSNRRDRKLRFGLELASGRWVVNRLDDFWEATPISLGAIRIREGGRRTAVPHRRR
jgi:hypothetical protein